MLIACWECKDWIKFTGGTDAFQNWWDRIILYTRRMLDGGDELVSFYAVDINCAHSRDVCLFFCALLHGSVLQVMLNSLTVGPADVLCIFCFQGRGGQGESEEAGASTLPPLQTHRCLPAAARGFPRLRWKWVQTASLTAWLLQLKNKKKVTVKLALQLFANGRVPISTVWQKWGHGDSPLLLLF